MRRASLIFGWLLTLSVIIGALPAQAASVNFNLTWTDTPATTNPVAPTHYRVEELTGTTWNTLAVIAAPTKSFVVTGKQIDQVYTFRIMQLRDGIPGAASPAVLCGLQAPNSNIVIQCGPVLIP